MWSGIEETVVATSAKVVDEDITKSDRGMEERKRRQSKKTNMGGEK